MNAAHLHLISNHLPLVGLGFAVVLNLFAVLRKSEEMKKLSSWFYILIAVLCIVPVLTGDGAGEILKTYPGISDDAIENHENWGYIFFYGLLGNGLLSLIAVWYAGKKPALVKKLRLATLIIGIIFLFFAYQAGTTGGMLRHPEMEQGVNKS